MSYHKALVDIISMVKHAAREDEPLYTAEQRVTRATLTHCPYSTATAAGLGLTEHLKESFRIFSRNSTKV
jgi:hypothetical protein